MKSTYCLVLIVILLASCSTAPSADTVQTAIAQTQIAQPTSTTIPTPTESKPSISETCKNQLTRFLEEGTKLNAMTEQGVNYNDFQQQLATGKGAYDLAIATCPSGFIPEAQVDIEKAFEGWGLALSMLKGKINQSQLPIEPDKNGYDLIVAYARDKLTYDTCMSGVKCLGWDPNISVLLSMASDYYSLAQKQILAELP
jgi:hypothetical protein